MLKQPDKRNLNKEQFINFLNEQKVGERNALKVKALPNIVNDFVFNANVVIIPLGSNDKIINYSINYVNENNDDLYKKMIFSNVEEALKYIDDIVVKS